MKKLIINTEDKKSHINPEIYGHFSEHLGRCIYEGIYVGEDSRIPNTNGVRNDIIEAFKKIKMPVLRWPGGCFADEYHWKDGVGEKSTRKKMVNTNWGGVTEDNSFGTHEFLRLCELVGCEPYISGNVGSGTVQELSEWVEYMTSDCISPITDLRKKNGRENAWKLKYLGIGNESWGCGGNMDPQYYSDLYKRYSTFCREYSGNHLYRIASGGNADDYNWTEVCMKNIGNNRMNGISLHYYTVPTGVWEHKGDAVEFSDDEYYNTIKSTYFMDTLIRRHGAIMDKYDPDKKVALIVDEWGCWFDVEKGTNPGFLYQQNTMRDALVAAINLDIFNHHSDRVKMANIAQAVNVLQAIVLTEGDKMVLTPTYHVFDLYKEHMDNTLCYSYIENENIDGYNLPEISQSVSLGENNELVITISNCSLEKAEEISAFIPFYNFSEINAQVLSGKANDHNTFDNAENVTIKPLETVKEKDGIRFTLPPCSVASIVLK